MRIRRVVTCRYHLIYVMYPILEYEGDLSGHVNPLPPFLISSSSAPIVPIRP